MRTNDEILDFFEHYLAQLQLPEEPQRLYEPIIYSMSGGGKRLRPVLLLLCCEAFGGDSQEALPAAAAVEMFHNFTLLHDDIMDNAAVRRGKPSVQARWGENVAILSGDTMMIYSYRLMSQIPECKLARVMEIFTSMALQVCEGQQYDMDFEEQQKVSVPEYMQMIELKTAALLAGSAMIGAVLGDASEEDCRRIYRFAQELGLAFQLQDDLLDVYADEALFGKKIGGDICCNKKTYLLIKAMNLASREQLSQMKEWMEKSEFDAQEKIAFFTGIYNELGVKEACEKRIAELFEECDSYIEALSVPAERKASLKAFADSLLNRNL